MGILRGAIFIMTAAALLLACQPAPAPGDGGAAGQTLIVAAYTTPREAFEQTILPAFAADWLARTGQVVRFETTYQGSGAQARAVVGGLQADVVALSLEPDIAKLMGAGLVSQSWKAGPDAGIVSRSVVVLAVRPGNPLGIRGWADLARPDVQVVTPNVRTSGGAMWNVAAIYGAAVRGHGEEGAAGTPAEATRLLGRILANVKVMDKGARESMLSFEGGVGDVAITYENEVLVARQAGKAMDYVVPPSTLRIDNPAAVVDGYAAARGTTELATAFVAFLHGPVAQEAYGRYGLRPLDAERTPPGLPTPADLFTIEDLGGWAEVQRAIFASGAAYDQALALSRKDR